MAEYGRAILVGLFIGTLTRWLLLRIDYRQYPTYPHAYITHLALGFLAAFLGAVAVPALVAREFTAVTFLALAAQQFREIRNMERETLSRMEDHLLVPRGPDYVEGIARVFEARNYFVMFASLVSSTVTQFFGLWFGIGAGLGATLLFMHFMSGRTIGDIAEVDTAEVTFDGPSLYVGGIFIMNVGLRSIREEITRHAVGIVLRPKDPNARDTLASLGQRQAIAHDVSTILGIRKDTLDPEFTPLLRRDLDSGEVGMYIVPMERDPWAVAAAVRRVPVLESSKGRSLSSSIGRRAARD